MAFAGSPGRTGNLPAESTSFVGRRGEIAEARRMLGRARIVTLTGVGGVGKSRLALRVAASVRGRFPGGVWLVELAVLDDAALLPLAAVNSLGIMDQSEDPPLRVLTDYLRDRQALLVLDNCEHLIGACVELCETVLRAAPRVRVLATSRQSLRADGEHIQVVGPLATRLPEGIRPTRAQQPGAVSLFAHRAAVAVPGFAVTAKNRPVVAHVCHRLEGLPLAIELAAVRLGTLGMDQLVTQLDDRFELLTAGTPGAIPRHRTLRAAIDWSFQLCTPGEQRLWARSSVFAGTFDLASAEGISDTGGPRGETVYDLVDGLVDKSVLAREDNGPTARYRLLETVRQYGQDKLSEAGETSSVRERHRDWYLALAEEFDADWLGPRQLDWAARMVTELPNLRAALGYCLAEPEQSPSGLRLVGALNYLWVACGQSREGRLWLERMLAVNPEPSRERSRALLAFGSVLTFQGLHDKAATPLRECVALARESGDPLLLARALEWAGLNAMHRAERVAGISMTEEAVAVTTGAGDPQLAYAVALWFRAMASIMDAEPAAASMELLMRARDICAAHDEKWMLSWVLVTAIPPAMMSGDPVQAGAFARECIPLHVALNDPSSLNVALNWLAGVAAAEQDFRRVARLFGAERRLALAVGGSPFDTGELQRVHDDMINPARAALGDESFDAEFRQGYDLPLDEAVAYAIQPPG